MLTMGVRAGAEALSCREQAEPAGKHGGRQSACVRPALPGQRAGAGALRQRKRYARAARLWYACRPSLSAPRLDGAAAGPCACSGASASTHLVLFSRHGRQLGPAAQRGVRERRRRCRRGRRLVLDLRGQCRVTFRRQPPRAGEARAAGLCRQPAGGESTRPARRAPKERGLRRAGARARTDGPSSRGARIDCCTMRVPSALLCAVCVRKCLGKLLAKRLI